MSFLNVAHAQVSPGVTEAAEFVARVNETFLFPLIAFLTALALLYFMYGAFLYIIHADDSHAREEGRRHIMWSIIGMLIMLIAYTILSIAAGTIGVEDELDCANDPTAANCAGRASRDLGSFNP